MIHYINKCVFILFLFVSTMASAQGFGFGFPGMVDPDHVPKDPFIKETLPVAACSLSAQGRQWQLNEAVGSHERAFELLEMTPTGKKLLSQFRELNREHPHEFVHLNYNVRRSYGFLPKAGAVYMYDGEKRKIFYDPTDDLGLVAIMLSHELMHAIDPEVPVAFHEETAAYGKVSAEDYSELRKRNSFRIERRGFDMQDRVLPELLQLSSCYESFIQNHRDLNGLKLFSPTPDSFIREAYGID